MDSKRLLELFQQSIHEDSGAIKELADYLQALATRATGGDEGARQELEKMVYDVAHDQIGRRMKVRYPYLVQRGHSAASILHEAWMRILRAQNSPPIIGDPIALFHRVAYLARYAFLDIVATQRKWDERYRQMCGSQQHMDVPDSNSPDPSRLAMLEEFSRKVDDLPEDLREVFQLHGPLMGLPFRRIAALLNKSEHHVRVMWLDTLSRLGTVLPDDF